MRGYFRLRDAGTIIQQAAKREVKRLEEETKRARSSAFEAGVRKFFDG